MEFIASGTYAATGGATSITLVPGTSATINPAGVTLAVVCSKNNDTHTCSNPVWTKISQVNAGTGFTASLWAARTADVTANSVFSWATSAAAGAQRLIYNGAGGPAEVVGLIANSSNSGTTNPHTTASFNTTKPNALAVYIDVSAANTALTQPPGWTERYDIGSATGETRISAGDKTVATAGTATGAISITGAAAAWVQWQIELYVASGTNTEISKAETGTVLKPLNGLVVSKAESGVVLDIPLVTATVDLVDANVLRSIAAGAITARRVPIVNLVT